MAFFSIYLRPTSYFLKSIFDNKVISSLLYFCTIIRECFYMCLVYKLHSCIRMPWTVFYIEKKKFSSAHELARRVLTPHSLYLLLNLCCEPSKPPQVRCWCTILRKMQTDRISCAPGFKPTTNPLSCIILPSLML